MIDIEKELQEVWTSRSFKEGNRHFWLFNYNFFRILDEKEFTAYNTHPLYENKKIFAVGGQNPDEDECFLYYDTVLKKGVFILSNYTWKNKRGIKKIGESVSALFETSSIADVLIAGNDSDFGTWSESVFHSSEIEEKVPKGVLPAIDLRFYFANNVPGTMLIDHNEINTKAFHSYFREFGVEELIPADFFYSFRQGEDYLTLITSINTHLKEETFFCAEFNPSGYFGVGNYKLLSKEKMQVLDSYGLILPNL